MLRPLILAAVVAATAHAQATVEPRPLVVLTALDIHRAPVRFRPADSATAWTEGVALRRDPATFSVVDSRGQMVFAPRTPPLRIEAFAPGYVSGKRMLRGALLGGAVGAGLVILDAYTCRDKSGDGPPCGIVIVLTPVAGAFGALVGGAIGALLPSRKWVPVARLHPDTCTSAMK
jgi:hypothetical protein